MNFTGTNQTSLAGLTVARVVYCFVVQFFVSFLESWLGVFSLIDPAFMRVSLSVFVLVSLPLGPIGWSVVC